MDNYKAEALINHYNKLKDNLKKELEDYQKANQAKVNDLCVILKMHKRFVHTLKLK